MLVSIENEVLEKYPATEIGYLVLEFCKERGSIRRKLKTQLKRLSRKPGINATNLQLIQAFPSGKIYEEDFQVKQKPTALR